MKPLLPLLLFTLALFPKAEAQEDIYKMELGAMLGGSFYLGDANYTSLYKGTRPMGGIVARYIFNPRIALKANLAMAGIKGSTEGNENRFPTETSFSRTLYDLGVQAEFGFWPYGLGSEYLGYKRCQPYLIAGMGFTYAGKPAKSVVAVNFPVGIGLKYKLKPRWNIGVEFTMRFSTSDELDVTNSTEALNDPYRIKSGGLKNKDSYSFTSLFITYDLFPQCQNCNKLEN
ncbi:MAG: outer membrane beta-barrel protein [Bacteroidaceae bacterium]|nr:outer membrane beta-barrel protein [Bacteroidaceae bacterium]MBP9637192.1 outer membrane beta-barrel protein [Bacteroidaceae bacterium]